MCSKVLLPGLKPFSSHSEILSLRIVVNTLYVTDKREIPLQFRGTLGSSFSFLGIGTIVPFLHAEGMQQFLRQVVKKALRKEQQKSFLSTSAGTQVS